MSKIKETIAKICSTIAIIPIASLALIACTNNSDAENKKDNADNTSNISNPRPNPKPDETPDISDDNKEVHSLAGLYSFTRNFDVNDIVFENEEELVTFFKTKDVNGAKKAAVELGFYDFVNSIMKHEDKEVAVIFSNNEFDGFRAFTYVEKTSDLSYRTYEEKGHKYKVTEDGYVTYDDDPIISFDSEANEVTLLYQFSYVNESGETVDTPMFFKTTLEYNNNTDGIGVSYDDYKIYTYKTGSSFLNISENHVKYNKMLSEVANRLGIDGEPTPAKISEFFSKDKIAFGIDYKLNRLYYALREDNSTHIVPMNEATNTYDFYGFSFEILKSINENEIRLSAKLDSEVKFEITLNLENLDVPTEPELPTEPETPVEPEVPENPDLGEVETTIPPTETNKD